MLRYVDSLNEQAVKVAAVLVVAAAAVETSAAKQVQYVK